MNEPYNDLWGAWFKGRSTAARNKLVVAYQPFLEHVVRGIRRPSWITEEELLSDGQLGLMSAIERYDPSFNVPFVKYAGKRIRETEAAQRRSSNWAGRRALDRSTNLNKHREALTHQLGRQPTSEELAASLGVSVDYVHQQDAARWAQGVVSLDSLFENEGSGESLGTGISLMDPAAADPDAELDLAELRDMVAGAIEELEGAERMVFHLYYFEGARMADIARTLGISSGQVSKLQTRAIAKITELIEAGGSPWAGLSARD